MVSRGRRESRVSPFPTSLATLSFDKFVDFLELAVDRLERVSGEDPTPRSVAEAVKLIEDRIDKLPAQQRTLINLYCDLVQPFIQAGIESPIGRRVIRSPRGKLVRAGVATVTAACILNRVKRAGGPKGVVNTARKLAEEALEELISKPSDIVGFGVESVEQIEELGRKLTED